PSRAQIRLKCGDVSYGADDKVIVSLSDVNGIAHPEPLQRPTRRRHNLSDIEVSEADRHADMAADEVQPLVEALGIGAGVVRQQLDKLAAALAGFAKRPMHELLADTLAAAMRSDANILDQSARGALRAESRQDAKLQAADDSPALAFRHHQREVG